MASPWGSGRARGGALGLLGNRNFTLLWAGDTLSELGSQATTLAMPLLVLALTGSPAKAGLVGLARSVAYPLAPLPGGVIVDRFDRRRVMLACASCRAVAMASVALAIALGRPSLGQLMAVAFVNAALWSVARIAERGLLPAVVAREELSDAVAINEARESVAVVGGPPLGGALFALARGLPFVADAVSFVAAGMAALAIRPARRPAAVDPTAPSGAETPARLRRELLVGLSWLWRRPFLRAGAILYAAANVTLGAVELLAVLVARHHGAGSAAVGLAFAIVGAGGVAGAVGAGPVRRRVSARAGVLLEPWFGALFVPLLLVAHAAALVGLVVATALLPVALSSSLVVGRRISECPEHLLGRVQAASAFISATIAWVGPLAVGQLFQDAGETAAVLSLCGWALLVALGATASRGLRDGA